ncbi:peptide/nickel transport system ATP-binding protein [Streptomyces aurantiacus]|uniref:dipeptide ABC transporter ATP-binding protein n=1 Tax=Streptomyces aurantiacus TaxID=47760 RepID=UPI00278D258E|nr:ABC transporter ATP-binding protein [Streptomyces aurantiacus]MDQ0772222.1 peptide/nickel transport system ATP-binding protein [Streptomyces aurantiacus]
MVTAAMTGPLTNEPVTNGAGTDEVVTHRAAVKPATAGDLSVGGSGSLLEVRGLSVSYRTRGGIVRAVRGVDLDVRPGEVTAVVGESGSGKSTTAHAVIRLLAANGGIDAGTVRFGRHDLTSLTERELRTVRGAGIGLVPQDPSVSLNPVKRIGEQVAEVLRIHRLATRRSAPLDAIAVLDQAGLPDAATRARQYPHELSGGMRQRALIAIAIAAKPKLIIADEPTSALDVTVQRVILDHLQHLVEEAGTSVLLVTHDLGVAADRAHRIVVMSQGRVVETGPTRDILENPQHEYTRRLLAGAPSLTTARFRARIASPPVAETPAADAQAAGTRAVDAQAADPRVVGEAAAPLVELRGVVKEFRLPRTAGSARTLRAVDDVSLTVHRGRTLALVGESGSGKSTTARLALRLTDPTAGHIIFDGADVTTARGTQARQLRRRAQLIYQNPYASLDPRFSIGEVISEPLRAFKVGDRASRLVRARDLLGRVALPASVLDRRPAELSGGQRQRVAIARALALSPDLVVCDEPVSALDVSVQGQVLELLAELQADTGVAYLFISHDLAVVRQIAHRVAVMKAGRIVETGTAEDLFTRPGHDYTRELLAAIPGGRHRDVRKDLSSPPTNQPGNPPAQAHQAHDEEHT